MRPAADAYTLSLDGFGRSATTFGAGLDVAFRTGWTLSLLFDREQGSDGGSTGFGLRLAYGLPGTVRDTDGVARREDSPPASTPPR